MQILYLALTFVIPSWGSLIAQWKPSLGFSGPECDSVAYSEKGGNVLVFDSTATLWSGKPAHNFAMVNDYGIRPSQRLSPATAFSVMRSVLIVWSGESFQPSGYLSDLFTYNVRNRTWGQHLLKQSEQAPISGKSLLDYRQTNITAGGCVCMASWETDVCGEVKKFNGCGMSPPCDGDNGGVAGQSWCLVMPSSSCKMAGQDWDYCVGRAPSVSSSFSLPSAPRVLQASPIARSEAHFCWTSNEETTLLLYGGSGSYDGKFGSASDVVLADAWLLDVATWSWSPLSTLVKYSTASDGTRLDLQNVTMPGLTGHRLGRVDKTIFVFGGYTCKKRAPTLPRGPDCLVDSMHGYLVDQQAWFRVEKSGYWPAARAFHSFTVVGSQLWMFGGGSVNSFGAWELFQDVSVFDSSTLQWSAVAASRPPSARWGHIALSFMDGIWTHGGCVANGRTFSDSFALSMTDTVSTDTAQKAESGQNASVVAFTAKTRLTVSLSSN